MRSTAAPGHFSQITVDLPQHRDEGGLALNYPIMGFCFAWSHATASEPGAITNPRQENVVIDRPPVTRISIHVHAPAPGCLRRRSNLFESKMGA
jgi:hypothetical protein